jgi:hypothetical protein
MFLIDKIEKRTARNDSNYRITKWNDDSNSMLKDNNQSINTKNNRIPIKQIRNR